MTRKSLRAATVSVVCAILLGACSLTPAGADQTRPATSPGSCPASSSTDLARQRVDYRDGGAERLAALLATRLADTTGAAPPVIHAFDPCLVIASIPGGGDVLSVRPRFAEDPNLSRGFDGPTLVMYQYAGRWRSAALVSVAGSGPHTSPGWSYPVLVVAARPSGVEVIAEGEIASAGSGEARLELFRMDDQPVALWRSPARLACGYSSHILSPEVLLEAWVDLEDTKNRVWVTWPNVGLGCVDGTRREQLWERRGDVFVASATRIVPSPRDVLEAMLGSLQRSDRAAALRYATDAAVVDRAVPVVTDPRFAYPESQEEALNAAQAEQLFWDALPAALRGPAPPTTVSVQVGPYKLTVVRRAAGWLVSDVARTN